jgi:peptide/nickel transport system substrate-binding protein
MNRSKRLTAAAILSKLTRMITRRLPPAAAAVLFSVLLFAAGAENQETEYLVLNYLSGARGGSLVAATSAEPATFNRMLTPGLANAIVAERLFSDLVHFNRLTYELEPALATRWDSADGKAFTIGLRRGVRFSDGSPFTSDDVVFTFEALLDSRTRTVQADQIKIEGMPPTVSKIDAYTVRLVFPKLPSVGLRVLSSIPMLPRHRLQAALREGKFNEAWNPAAAPAEINGTGPFRLKEYRRGSQIVLERNPYFWKKDKAGQVLPYLDTLVFLVIPDRNAEALRFQSGELDLLNSLNAENYAALRRAQPAAGFLLKDLGPGLAQDFLWFNLNPGKDPTGAPLVDPEKQAYFARSDFRRAVSHAIDRDGIARAVLLSLGSPQYGPISSGNTAWYNPGIARTPFDIARAKNLLAAAGMRGPNAERFLEMPATGRPMTISLITSQGNLFRERAAQIVKENLGKVGIRVDVQAVPMGELRARAFENYKYEAILWGFDPQDVIPDPQADLWLSSGSNHFWHPKQARPQTAWESEMDQAVSRLTQSIDPGIRKKAFARVQEIWAIELPAIPLVAPNVLAAWSQRVGNVRPSILGPQLLWNAEELNVKPRRGSGF